MNRAYDIAAFRALDRRDPLRGQSGPGQAEEPRLLLVFAGPEARARTRDRRRRRLAEERSRSETRCSRRRHSLAFPVTPRGGGTGNYGQAMPLTGGVLLNLAEMNARPANRAPAASSPSPARSSSTSTRRPRPRGRNCACSLRPAATATIGGFVAGGSGGVGSITWGGLRDFGNVLRLRVLTMEAEPRALELTGADLHKAVHAYGTNGVITEVEMPLAPPTTGSTSSSASTASTRRRAYATGARRAGRHPEEARHRGRRARRPTTISCAIARLIPRGKSVVHR